MTNIIKNFFRTSETGEEKKYTQNGLLLLLCRVIILGMTIACLLKGFTAVYYHEIDSYVLPTVSMEYRQSLIITQEDIDRAKIDFPNYYENVDDFESLRCSGLVKITEDKWLAFYFPSYSMFCLPLKLLFQLLGFNQIFAFSVTNALFVIVALIFLYRNLKVPPLFKLLSVLLFVISPIDMYIQYISAEAVMFSLITISLVMYSNEKYRLSALLLSVASMTNPTVMGIGIVMVAVYLIKMFRNRKNVKIFSRKNIFDTLIYACCYIPCLIPFIFNAICIGKGNPTASGATLVDYGARLLTYFFDVDMGFFSFAPLTLIVFFVLAVISVIKKDFSALTYLEFLIAPVMAYSLMIYINCAKLISARYIIWTYPVLFIGMVILGSRIIRRDVTKYIVSASLVVTTAFMVTVNREVPFSFEFNATSKFLMDNAPQLYTPYRANFYSRLEGIAWPFEIDTPCYYYSERDGMLRKLLIRSTEEYKKEVISAVKGTQESLDSFSELVNSVPSDGKFHYINISPLSGIELWEKNSEELGLIRERRTVLETKNGFTVGKQGVSIELEETSSEKPCLYKLEIGFDKGLVPSMGDDFTVDVFDITLNGKEFTTDDSGAFKTIFACTGSNLNTPRSLKMKTEKDTNVSFVRLTEMENTESTSLSDTPIEYSGDDGDGILIPAPFEPRTKYFLDMEVSGIEADDEVYCMVYYQKRFIQNKPSYRLSNGENRFLIDSGDTTIVLDYPNDGLYIKIYGETENPIVIENITLSLAE